MQFVKNPYAYVMMDFSVFICNFLKIGKWERFSLFQGYGGADEAKMLQRHLCGTSAKIGVGANRAATAYSFLKQYGYMNLHNSTYYERLLSHEKVNNHSNSGHIGAAILDDGMQVLVPFSFRRLMLAFMSNISNIWLMACLVGWIREYGQQ